MDGFMVGYYCEGEDKLATEDFRHENLIIIPLQIKARVKISLSPNANTLVCPFIRLPNGHTYKPLHLAIFMDLVTEASFRSGGQAKLTKEKAVSGTGRKKYEWAGHSPTPEHEAERFCLNIRGHGSEQYPIIARYESAFQKFLKRSLRLDGLRDFRQQWEMKFR